MTNSCKYVVLAFPLVILHALLLNYGTDIPAHLLNRIFQPFFTTKPAGKGTGLGLSLSYDIITKGHGGTLKVESEENEYTEFIIFLPKQNLRAY